MEGSSYGGQTGGGMGDGGQASALATQATNPMHAALAQALVPQPKPGALRQREYRAKYGAAYREKHKLEARAWRAKNSEGLNQKARAYRAKNPDKVRSSNLKKTYGITLDQFNDLFRSQDFKCAICRSDASKGKNWHVDHCHQTEKIRGILCQPCNLMIGHAGDDVEKLLAAVEYLK